MSGITVYTWYQVTVRAKSVSQVADAFCTTEEDILELLEEQDYDLNIRNNLLFHYYWNLEDSICNTQTVLARKYGLRFTYNSAIRKASALRAKGWKLKSYAGKTRSGWDNWLFGAHWK